MFFVINKSKICSYAIALSTVVILFVVAAKINDVVSPSQNTIQTNANVLENNITQDSCIM